MAIKKTSVKEVTSKSIYCLIAGASGAGKTYLASTLPEKDTMIISKESGLLALRKTGKNFNVLEIENFDDFAQIIQMVKEGKIKEKNIYIDSLTDILDTEVAALKKKYPDKKNAFVWYEQYEMKLKWAITALRDVGDKNIFFTCLTQQVKNGVVLEDHFDFYGTKLKGKMKSFFDLVMVVEAIETEDGEKRILYTSILDHRLAKDRSGLLEATEEADLSVVINKILK